MNLPKCPVCNGETKRYPKYPDSYGNPTDASYVSYCTNCEWEDVEPGETK